MFRRNGWPMGEGHQELDKLLSFFKDAGEEQSEGKFRLDPDWVEKSLDRFLLPYPENYVLHAVAAAVSSGASNVSVKISAGLTVLEHDGRWPEHEELKTLYASLLLPPDRSNIYLREMAIAVNNARSLGSKVRILTPESLLEVKGRRFRVVEGRTLEGPPRIEFQRNRLKGWFFEVGARQTRLLEARCALSPVPISLNGKPIEPDSELDGNVLTGVFGELPKRLPPETSPESLELPSFVDGFVCLGVASSLKCWYVGLATNWSSGQCTQRFAWCSMGSIFLLM